VCTPSRSCHSFLSPSFHISLSLSLLFSAPHLLPITFFLIRSAFFLLPLDSPSQSTLPCLSVSLCLSLSLYLFRPLYLCLFLVFCFSFLYSLSLLTAVILPDTAPLYTHSNSPSRDQYPHTAARSSYTCIVYTKPLSLLFSAYNIYYNIMYWAHILYICLYYITHICVCVMLAYITAQAAPVIYRWYMHPPPTHSQTACKVIVYCTDNHEQ